MVRKDMSNVLSTTISSFKDVWRRRTFLWLSVKAELKASCFAGSWFSVSWWLLEPLLLMFVYLLVIEVLKGGQIQYGALFIYSAVLPYRWFCTAMSRSSSVLIASAGLIKHAHFPKVIMPLATVLANTIHFFFGCVILVVLLFLYKVDLTIWMLFFPLIVLVQFALTLGVGMFLAAATVFVRDVQGVVPFVLRLLLFSSPIFYNLDAVPERWRSLVMLNPLTPLITSYKNVLLYQRAPLFLPLLCVLGAAIVLMVAGLLVYTRIDKKFAHWI